MLKDVENVLSWTCNLILAGHMVKLPGRLKLSFWMINTLVENDCFQQRTKLVGADAVDDITDVTLLAFMTWQLEIRLL